MLKSIYSTNFKSSKVFQDMVHFAKKSKEDEKVNVIKAI